MNDSPIPEPVVSEGYKHSLWLASGYRPRKCYQGIATALDLRRSFLENFWKSDSLARYYMDRLTPSQRSANMSKIRGKDTVPEKKVRSILHRLGFRFSTHKRDLPGCPDIVLRKWNTVVFVHGCFLHSHANCKDAVLPKARREFWLPKLNGNANRDGTNEDKLRELGWRVVTIWECEIANSDFLAARLYKVLRNGAA